MYWVFIILASLLGLFGLIVLIGVLIPKGHTTSRSLMLDHVGPDQAWEAIADFASQASWRTGYARFERVADPAGREIWKEFNKRGEALTLETTLARKPLRLVRTIADPSLPFSGRWEFDLHPMTGGTRITITEVGEVHNPIFRFIGKIFMNPAAHIDAYLTDLARRFNIANPRISN